MQLNIAKAELAQILTRILTALARCSGIVQRQPRIVQRNPVLDRSGCWDCTACGRNNLPWIAKCANLECTGIKPGSRIDST